VQGTASLGFWLAKCGGGSKEGVASQSVKDGQGLGGSAMEQEEAKGHGNNDI